MSLVLLTFYRRDHTRDARELDPALYGVNAASTEKVSTEGLVSGGESLGATATVADIVTFLNKVYCSTIGVEFEFTVSGRDDGGVVLLTIVCAGGWRASLVCRAV